MSRMPNTVVCVANKGNEVSLQLWKIYKALPDAEAELEGMLRVVDEDGEDYLFPEENFVPIELPAGMRTSFERSVRLQRKGATQSGPARSLKVVRSSAIQPKRRRARGA